MKTVRITVDDYLYEFYRKVGENAGGLRPEAVMEHTLFRLAGTFSIHAQEKKKKNGKHSAK